MPSSPVWESAWNLQFAQLQAFKRKHGHVDGPFRVHHPALSQWVTTQRRRYRARELAPERVVKLERIGLRWEGNLEADELVARDLEALLRFRREHGHFWVSNARRDSFRRFVSRLGKPGGPRLQPAQRAALELLGFPGTREGWEWEKRLGTLTERVRAGKGFEVGKPSKLGPWIATQRSLAVEGRLTGQRALRLSALGMFDEANLPQRKRDQARSRRDARFAQTLARWKRSRELDAVLKEWEATQRRQHRNGTLRPERLSLLRAAGFDLQPSRPHQGRDQRRWQTWYQELVRFSRKHGHTRVLRTDRTFAGLGSWLSKLRVDKKRGLLSAAEVRALEALGFDWTPFDTVWEKMFARLARWSRAHGHGNISRRSREDPGLGSWLQVMRGLKARGKLPVKREAQLSGLDVYWNRRDIALTRRVDVLEGFKRRHGRWPVKWSELPPVHARKLRLARAAGVLPAALEKRLERGSFEWDEPGRIDDERLGELKAHYRAQRHHAVPDAAPWCALHGWIQKLRQRARAGELSRRMRSVLKALDFPFERFEIEWERCFALAATWQRTHGHLSVSGEGPLATWLEGQRGLFRAGVLDGGREDRLRDLGAELETALGWTLKKGPHPDPPLPM